jgi:hypothetical protein
LADCTAAVVDNHINRTYGVKIDNVGGYGAIMTTGAPMGMLEIWQPAEPGGPPSPGFGGFAVPNPPVLAQNRNYILHFGDRIINTIPEINSSAWDTRQGIVQSANPPR